MNTNELIFSPRVTHKDLEQEIQHYYERFHNKMSGIYSMVDSMTSIDKRVNINLKAKYKPNHACAWNRTSDIGRLVYIGAQSKDKLFTVVLFVSDLIMTTYRTEDLTLEDSLYDKLILQS